MVIMFWKVFINKMLKCINVVFEKFLFKIFFKLILCINLNFFMDFIFFFKDCWFCNLIFIRIGYSFIVVYCNGEDF